jgi:hypothetical protein
MSNHQPETQNFIHSSVYLDVLSPFKAKIKEDLVSSGLDYMSSSIQVVEIMLRGWGMYADAAPSLGLQIDGFSELESAEHTIILRKVDIDKYGQSFDGLVKNTSLGTYEYLGIK